MRALKCKRWLLFAGMNYYPQGGVLDFKGAFPSLEDALDWLKGNGGELQWAQFVPTYKGNVHFLITDGLGGWVNENAGECECHCGHPLAGKCEHEFVDGQCQNCFCQKQDLENHAT